MDSALRRFVPRNATWLAGFDVSSIQEAPLYRRHERQLDLPLLDAASERIGLNPRHDISEVLATWVNDEASVIIRGQFSMQRVMKKLISSGAREMKYRNETVLINGSQCVLFPAKNILVVGSKAAVQSVIENEGHGDIPIELAESLSTLPRGAQVWSVSKQPLLSNHVPMRSEIGSALSNIAGYVTATAVAANIASGLKMQADLICASEKGAEQVRDALRGVIGLARLTTKDDQLQMLRLYDAIHIDQDKQTIHINADLPPELADNLLAYLPRVQGKSEEMLSR
ncbi:MAG: hypothetical protein JOZ62_14400 [Acidobacteriaceae bacterium]|nr:hypothetical protein [Acidobacteriaceae bacterium]